MNTKLFVDDKRNPPDDSWDLARTFGEAIHKLQTKQYDHLSLDHDIGLTYDDRGNELNGYRIALWLAEQKHDPQPDADPVHIPPIITCHSDNPVGKSNILGVVERYLR